ncbi:MAG: type II toxin-antitoxin system VapC family toxin [Verrucomicrobia bacterium]|nr:type II toxin-antitoxin system VapC family toxin [Verrucomicrobiota bacterium]
MKPTVYVETTIPSLLTAWLNRDVEILAQQLVTREWWETRRQAFDLYVSQEVIKEAARGDAAAARDRLAALAECRILAATDLAEALTGRILSTGLIPSRAASDAVHIGYAAAHGMDFLLTWNCRHILNKIIERQLASVCVAMGLSLPVLCTPAELMATYSEL